MPASRASDRVPRTDTWDSAGCGTSRMPQSHNRIDRIVRDECPVRLYGTGRYRAAPSVAGPTVQGPSVEGTHADGRGRHRPLRADALSCRSVPSLCGSGYLDGQIVERTRRSVQPGFGDVEIAGCGLQIAMAKQKLDAAQIGARIEKM